MMEVRCCCVPQKLLGWVDIKDKGQDHILWPLAFRLQEAPDMPTIIELDVALFNPGDGSQPYRALKSMDYPIEVLRLIPGFKEHA